MKFPTLVLVLISGFLTASAAEAGRVRNHEANQRRRIHQGVESGQLTRGERKTLRQEQKDIHADKKEARSDGVVTSEERKEIRGDQAKASADIYRLKHNGEVRNETPPASALAPAQ